MIWTIAGGIILAVLLIDIILGANEILDACLRWTGRFLSYIYDFFLKCCNWFNRSAWYIKLGIFIILTLCLLHYEYINAWLCTVVFFSYFAARWLVCDRTKGKK